MRSHRLSLLDVVPCNEPFRCVKLIMASGGRSLPAEPEVRQRARPDCKDPVTRVGPRRAVSCHPRSSSPLHPSASTMIDTLDTLRAVPRLALAAVLGMSVVAGRLYHRAAPPDAQHGVHVDSAHHLVVVTLGPFAVPPAPPVMSHMAMHMEGGDSLVKRVYWPMTTLLQGLRMEILDASGQPLPRRLIHHLNLVNFDRRQLVYPLAERIMGFGQETEDVSVPRSIGLPITAGQRIGVFVMWDNETG